MNYLNTNDTLTLYSKNVNSDVYVDKSLLIEKISEKINTDSRYICITRPRRFGKSVNAHMLGAYYTKGYDCQDVFRNLLIAGNKKCEEHRNNHNVIFIDLSRMPLGCKSYENYIEYVYNRIKSDLEETFPKLKDKRYTDISDMLKASENKFIFILDEWDSIFYKKFMTEDEKKTICIFLKICSKTSRM